jgi:outer membrane protein assembly factor BamB
MGRLPLFLVAICLVLVGSAFPGWAMAEAGDWAYWRGPESNGISRDTGLIDNWNPRGGQGDHVAWKRDDLGGRSTPIVMKGKLYTIVRSEPGTAREGERVVCLDAMTGQTIWENRFNVYLTDVPDTRVGWSSCVGDPDSGRVYALGVCGLFQCLDADTGKTVWAHPLHEKFGLISTYGGRTNFPVVFEDLVLISAVVVGWGDMARPTHRFLAFDKETGEVVWFRGTRPLPEDTTYSSPTVTVVNGQAALIFGSGDGSVWALEPRTGLPIWNFDLSRRGLNVSPLVVGNKVFMSHSEENIEGTKMGAVVAIDAGGAGDVTSTGQLWRMDEIVAGKSSPLVVDDRLLIIDDRAKLHIFDTETGEQIGRRIAFGTAMNASPLYADGKIYVFTANGRWYILEPDERNGVRTIRQGRMPADEEVQASPIAWHGRIYVQSSGALYCLHDPDKPYAAKPVPKPPLEQPSDEDPSAAHLQVVPAEVLMRPGETQQFQVRLYNSRGQRLADAKAAFAVDGRGSISQDGTFTAPADLQHVASAVVARVGGLEGRARIRIVPLLPWKFDFDEIPLQPATGQGEPPITWVGARYRHVIRQMDGGHVMVKVTTIPKGTRSRCWFGHCDLHDYTIQADVRGASQMGKMPDIGLIAQGYTLDLQGASQKLQLRTWDSQLRIAETVEFPWKPNTWYTMKLRAEVKDGEAIVRGKVWPREESEPEAWSVETVDPSPNLSGSPGLFGKSDDAEIFLDNIVVRDN